MQVVCLPLSRYEGRLRVSLVRVSLMSPVMKGFADFDLTLSVDQDGVFGRDPALNVDPTVNAFCVVGGSPYKRNPPDGGKSTSMVSFGITIF